MSININNVRIQELSLLIQKTPSSSIETIAEINQELIRDKQIIERALARHNKMINRVEKIEKRLIQKGDVYNYENISKVIQRKNEIHEQRKVRETKKQNYNQNKSILLCKEGYLEDQVINIERQEQIENNKENTEDTGSSDEKHEIICDEGFQSCEEELLEEEKYVHLHGYRIESDLYAEWKANKILDKKDRAIVLKSRYNLLDNIHLFDQKKWTFEKELGGSEVPCQMYSREGKFAVYRLETVFKNYTVDQVVNYFIIPSNFQKWTSNHYEKVDILFEQETTRIVHQVFKKTWPLGQRDVLALNYRYKTPDGKVFICGKSIDNPIMPVNPKMTRVQVERSCYLFEPINNGKDCKSIYFSEVDFKGFHIPKKFIMSFGAGEFIKDLGILKKVMEEERSNKIL